MERRRLYRDGGLAAATCVALLLGAAALGVDADPFVDPRLAVVGCVGMAGIEVGLLRTPDLTRRVWERRRVRVGSALGVLVGVGAAAWLGAVWAVAVVVWGLLAYLGLVGVVLVSGRNPLARLG
jgi:hypothetical protein